MKKLTIEHLAAYFPYGLKLYVNDHSRNDRSVRPDVWDVFKMDALSEYEVTVTTGGESFGDEWLSYDRVKPILRPLSDLTKEITHNGETFDPIEELGNALNDENMGYPDSYHDYKNPSNSGQDVEWLKEPWFIVSLLLSWHFDVYNLIDAGLAIDLNTLKK